MKQLILSCWLIGAFLMSNACDGCGGNSIGMDANALSANNGNSIGINVQAFHYKSILESAEEQQNILFSYTINGAYKAHKRVQLKFFLPVNWHVKQNEKNIFGLGDAVVLSTFLLLDKEKEVKKLQHRLSANVGLKMPTGVYNNDEVNNATSLPIGSKSWDFILGLNYSIRYKKYIHAASLLSNINTSNKYNYRFGNQVEFQSRHSYKVTLKVAQLYPFLALQTRWQAQDVSNNFFRAQTGGFTLSTLIGMQINFKQYKFVVGTSIPVYQNLNNQNLAFRNNYNAQFIYQF